MKSVLRQEIYQFYNLLPRTFFLEYNNMYGSTKKLTVQQMKKMTDTQYYKEHAKHNSTSHLTAMKALQKLGVDRDKAHTYVKKYVD